MGMLAHYSGMQALLSHAGLLGGDLVLMFHRVLPAHQMTECFDPHLVLSEDGFAGLLEILGNEYQLCSLAEIASAHPDKPSKPRVALTFDDGWEDTYRVAFPHLKRLNVPATVFLCTNLVGTNRLLPEERLARIWHHAEQAGQLEEFRKNLTTWGVPQATTDRSRLHAVKRIPNAHKRVMLSVLEQLHDVPPLQEARFVTWPEVYEMAAHGIEFGSHSASHVSLTAEPDELVYADLQQSIRTMTQHMGKAPSWLAYPNGLVDAFVVDVARQLGFQGAVSTRRGSMLHNQMQNAESSVAFKAHPFLLPRCNMESSCVATASRGCDPARLALYFAKHTWPHPYTLPARTQVRSASLNMREEPFLTGVTPVNHSLTMPIAKERCRQR